MPTTLGARFSALGPTFAVGSACSSASQSVGIGMQMIRSGMVDRAIVGGAEACVINATIRAWEGLRVMTPNLCRPFSKGRNGMSLGEGAAVFILETAEAARARGHEPLCELAGYGTTSDAKDPVRPDLDGASSCDAMALEDAGLAPEDVHYINAHGTATHANDITEVRGDPARLWRLRARGSGLVDEADPWPCARRERRAGACDHDRSVAFEQITPPTINFLEFDPSCPINAVPNEARPHRIEAAISNSFAFGGINAVLVVRHA